MDFIILPYAETTWWAKVAAYVETKVTGELREELGRKNQAVLQSDSGWKQLESWNFEDYEKG